MTVVPPPFSVLVAEDDPHIRDVLDYALRAEGYAVRLTARGAEAISLCAAAAPPDLLILDVGLPDVDGFTVCRRVRQTSERLPILFLTARGDETDRVVGLELGGDDYVTKPFSPRELVARVRALRRRHALLPPSPADGAPGRRGVTPPSPPSLRHGPLEIDEARFEVRCSGVPVVLTPHEFRLLALLAAHPGRVFTREQVLARAWEDGGAVTDRAIDAHVKTLRRKLAEAGGSGSAGENLIETVRGVGYRAREIRNDE